VQKMHNSLIGASRNAYLKRKLTNIKMSNDIFSLYTNCYAEFVDIISCTMCENVRTLPFWLLDKLQTFHYTRCITPKRIMS